MKNKSLKRLKFLSILAFMFIFISCNSSDDSTSIEEEQEVISPILQTNEATNITAFDARLGGNLLDEGSVFINERGVVWSYNTNPTIADNFELADGSGLGNFFVDINGDFDPNTTYNFRAFVWSSEGYYYGNNKSFTTLDNNPPPPPNPIELLSIKKITTNTMMLTGVVNQTSGSVNGKGFVLAEFSNPTINDIVAEDGDTGLGQYVVDVDDLDPRTIYYVRPYAYIQGALVYGNEFTIQTVGYEGEAGGYVVYDKGEITDGWRYMEASPQNMPETIWGCNGTLILGTSQDLGTGLENTNIILNNCTQSNIAARICTEYQLGGKSDWFLGSVEEMSIAVVSMAQNSTLLDYNAIWTSSQAGALDSFWVTTNSSDDGPFVSMQGKNFSLLVLPIRTY